MLEYFLDTSVVVAYASCFGDNEFIEKYGKDCELLMESDKIKIISKNVEKELNSIKKRRIYLYRSIVSIVSEGSGISEIESQIEVDDHLKKHLERLIKLTHLGKIEENLESFRRIEQIFNNRIRRAKTQLIKEIIDVNSKFNEVYPSMAHYLISWSGLLGERIGNINDGKILVDCIALSAIRGRLVFTTLDWVHILSKKEEIISFVEEYCSVIPSFSPDFELRHVTDVVR